MAATENVKFVGFYVNKEMHSQLCEEAKAQGFVSTAEFIRAALRNALPVKAKVNV